MTNIKKAYVWYDAEADYLEIDLGEPQEGETEETAHKGVLVKVDEQGNIIGFSILGVTERQKSKEKPFEVDLTSRRPPRNIRPRQRQSS